MQPRAWTTHRLRMQNIARHAFFCEGGSWKKHQNRRKKTHRLRMQNIARQNPKHCQKRLKKSGLEAHRSPFSDGRNSIPDSHPPRVHFRPFSKLRRNGKRPENPQNRLKIVWGDTGGKPAKNPDKQGRKASVWVWVQRSRS